MAIDQDKELKNAILNLPVKEKDKMLLKLISKDAVLRDQLRYQLLESEDLEQRRESVLREIDDVFLHMIQLEERWAGYLTAGQLSMELRHISGLVNHHILITKDKRLYMLESLFKLELKVLKTPNNKNQKLLAYLASRMKYVLDKFSKLHEDHQFDLQERINAILTQIKQSAVHTFMVDMMLPQSV
jgi:hypothetical protein